MLTIGRVLRTVAGFIYRSSGRRIITLVTCDSYVCERVDSAECHVTNYGKS